VAEVTPPAPPEDEATLILREHSYCLPWAEKLKQKGEG